MPDERTQFTALLFTDIRNAAVLKHPLPADEAVEVIQTYSAHPRWRLIGFPTESRPLRDALWQKARTKDFAFRKLYDTRSALTMTAQGVTEIATVSVANQYQIALPAVKKLEAELAATRKPLERAGKSCHHNASKYVRET